MANNISTIIPSTSSDLTFLPTDAWFSISAPGATNGQAKFDRGDATNGLANALIEYTFSQPATGFEYWGYQRSDGGLFNICFDCPSTSTLGDRIDALNASTNGTEPPRLLYKKYDLSYAVHNLTIMNLLDSRATIGNATNGAYGQITMDRFVLISPAAPPASSTSSTSSTGTAGSGTSTSSASSSASPAPGGSGETTRSSGSNAGAIAGGVIGGVAGVLLIVAGVLFFLWRRRRNQPAGIKPYDTRYASVPRDNAGAVALESGGRVSLTSAAFSSAAPATVATSPGAPFPTSDASSTQSPPLPPIGYTGGSTTSTRRQKGAQPAQPTPQQQQQRQPQPRHAQRPSDPLTTSPSVYPTTSESSWPTSGGDTVVPRREEDAGFLQGDEDDEPTLPPDYHAATARRR